MQIKLSDYVANFLVENGITQVFTVTGGGAMHLNNSLGHKEGLSCLYQHHEQACAIAAECYARINDKPAALCVTSGPGGTNALTGVMGAWLDSIPMIVLSGQVRYDTTARSTGLDLRAMGDQEFDIINAVGCMTKHSVMVTDPSTIRFHLEKAVHLATTGRPGPCWLDIPLNVQAALIDPVGLDGYDSMLDDCALPPPVHVNLVNEIIEKVKMAKRPVFNAGNGIRISGAFEPFRRVVEKLGIPVVTGFNSIDLIESAHPLYAGRAGSLGDRPGNFAIQNSDLVLSVGSRLSLRQVSYNYTTWAREAYTVVVDVDSEELKKPTLHVSQPVWADAKNFLETMDHLLPIGISFSGTDWLNRCRGWVERYPASLPDYVIDNTHCHPYPLMQELGEMLGEHGTVITSNGTVCVASSQAMPIHKGTRYIMNSACASMGYGLPAAIGAAVVTKRDVICLEGDGSLQMNIQELQTIIHNNLPIKLLVLNNQGYHSIRMTQSNYFGKSLAGIGYDSGDLSFPNLEKLAAAYGFPYTSCKDTSRIREFWDKMLSNDGPIIGEVFTNTNYEFAPKSTARQLPDGALVSSPLEDLAPFLSREELRENMIIPMVDS